MHPANVLVQVRGARELDFDANAPLGEDDAWAPARARLRRRIERETPASVSGWLVTAPLVLLRCAGDERAALLETLSRWPEVERAEAVFPEMDGTAPTTVIRRTDPGPSPPCSREMDATVMGFVDIGRPDLRHPQLELSILRLPHIPLFSIHGDEVIAPHPTSVLASYLEALGEVAPSRCLFESLPPGAGPFAWLASLDRLILRGAKIVNLSYGRLPLERALGWAALEWGTRLLCRTNQVLVVAAAGQPCDSLREGRRLHLPASAPEVLAADGEGRWWAHGPIEEGEEEILLASRHDPLGGREGSSFSAPRLAARVTEIHGRLPGGSRHPELLRAVLLAGARPSRPELPSPGAPESTRLWRIAVSRSFVHGNARQCFEWFSPMRVPQRVALCWRGDDGGPRLNPTLHEDAYRLYRGRRWLVADLPARVQRVVLEAGRGEWSLAWHPLDVPDLRVQRVDRASYERAS